MGRDLHWALVGLLLFFGLLGIPREIRRRERPKVGQSLILVSLGLIELGHVTKHWSSSWSGLWSWTLLVLALIGMVLGTALLYLPRRRGRQVDEPSGSGV